MLLGRRRLEEEGWGSRTLHAAVEGRQLHHVRRGWYLALRTWSELAPESRHRAEVVAADLAASGTRPVFSHASAAVLWGLPLYRLRPTRVHVTASPDRRHSTSGILRHEGTVAAGDVVERDGIRCTSLARTVVDLAPARSLRRRLSRQPMPLSLWSAVTRGSSTTPWSRLSWRTSRIGCVVRGSGALCRLAGSWAWPTGARSCLWRA